MDYPLLCAPVGISVHRDRMQLLQWGAPVRKEGFAVCECGGRWAATVKIKPNSLAPLMLEKCEVYHWCYW